MNDAIIHSLLADASLHRSAALEQDLEWWWGDNWRVKAAADLLRADGRFDIVKPTELLARVNKYVKKQK